MIALISLSLPQSIVFVFAEAFVAFALGYAFRGFISRELVKAAQEAKEYLAKADEFEDRLDQDARNIANGVKKL